MFAVDEDVARWEVALLPLHGPARLPLLVPLAWHLRQRDTSRARALADEALALLPETNLPPSDIELISARLQLVHAEAHWLLGELDIADQLATHAGLCLGALEDETGCSDAHWLRSWIATDCGDYPRRDAELERAAAAARRAADRQRLIIIEAVIARWTVLHDRHLAAARWGSHFGGDPDLPPASATWVHDYLGLSASLHNHFGSAASHYIQCYEAALHTGQLRCAMTVATNIGEDFVILNDLQSALEWMQSALDLARPTGWPRSVGACLMHTADTMRRLGRLDAAEELLQEALQLLAPLVGGRSYAIALQYQGELALDKGDYAAALHAFQRLEERADALRQADFQTVARRGQAHALCFLDRPDAALQTAARAVQLAADHSNAYNHIAALRVLSIIHTH
ncbi:MAG: tetratricopeptide repeat protein, partial [Sphingomonadaceae bacterium]